MTNPQPVKWFDRGLYAQRRNRIALSYANVDFLKREAAERLVDKLEDVTRSFSRIVDVGAHQGQLGQEIARRLGVQPILSMDVSYAMASHLGAGAIVGDEEWLPLRDSSVDLIVSALSVHVVNDLVGVLVQMKRALSLGGLMMMNCVGGASLHELRQCISQAETEIMGGISPRIIPMLDVRDAGDLLSRTGFSMPVADSEIIEITYANLSDMLRDIRQMGEANVLLARNRVPLSKDVLVRAEALYVEQFANDEGRLPVTIELISMTGWRDV